MKKEYAIIITAVAIAAVAFGAFALINNGGDSDVTVADVYDADEKMNEFGFVTDGNKRIDIAPKIKLNDDIIIDYFGGIKEWKKNPSIIDESNMVIFSTYLDASPVDYVFVFSKIESGSLKASFNDNGKPSISMKAQDGFGIELYYFDQKGGEDIQQYDVNTYEYMLSRNVTLPVYYGDSMFKVPATQRNPDMMMFALGLELCTANVDSERDKSVLRLMRDMGYLDAMSNDAYKTAPTIRSTDVAIGSKEWNGYNLILVMLNGTNYTTEFAANVMLGPSGDHMGFTLACNEALDLLRDFIKDNGITGKTKILLTGYSRTAAGANLAAAYLSDAIAEGKVAERIGNIELTQDDVYGYSFETPLCGLPSNGHVSPTDSRYDNIWYVINGDDPVTYVPPKAYGFVRFGHAVDLPSHDEASRTKMLELIGKYYDPSIASGYDMSKFAVISDIKDPKQLWEGFFVKFFDAVGDRQFYNKNIEDDFVQFIYISFAKPGVMQELVGDSTKMILFLIDMDKYSTDKATFDEHFTPLVREATKHNDCEEFTSNIVNSLYQLINVAKRYAGGSIYSLLSDPYALSMTGNYKIILMSHLPAMTYCYLVQESSLYN